MEWVIVNNSSYYVPANADEFIWDLEKGRWEIYSHMQSLPVAYNRLSQRDKTTLDRYVATHVNLLKKLKNMELNFEMNNTTITSPADSEIAEAIYSLIERGEKIKKELDEAYERRMNDPAQKIDRFWAEWRNGRIASPNACAPDNIPKTQEAKPITDACLFALDHIDNIIDAYPISTESKNQKDIARDCENMAFDSLLRSAYFSTPSGKSDPRIKNPSRTDSLKYQGCIEDHLARDAANERLQGISAGIIARLPAQTRQDIESKRLSFSAQRLRDLAADGWDESLISAVRMHGSVLSVLFVDPATKESISLSLTLSPSLGSR